MRNIVKRRLCVVVSVVCWLCGLGVGFSPPAPAAVADFEDLRLEPESYWSGFDSEPYPPENIGEEHPFFSNGVEFYNYHVEGYDAAWDYWYSYWEGWAYSNMTDTTTPGYANQYSAITGRGVAGSSNYGVAYLPQTDHPETDPFRRVPVEVANTGDPNRHGVYLTNTTYAYYTIRDGSFVAKPFGHSKSEGEWVDTQEPDWFMLTVSGLDASGSSIAAEPIPFYLADYRADENEDDYIVDRWTWLDVSPLVDGGAETLQFVFDSSDTGAYGINTPLYFALDVTLPTLRSTASGNWNADAVWEGDRLIPTADNETVVRMNHRVVVDGEGQDGAASSLEINGDEAAVVIDPQKTLQVVNDVQLAAGTLEVTSPGKLEVGGDFTTGQNAVFAAGLGPATEPLLAVAGSVTLGPDTELLPIAVDRLGDLDAGEWGDKTRTIITASGGLSGQFD